MAEYSCLIVEDSPMMRQLLVFALARVKNLRVTEADDGVDAYVSSYFLTSQVPPRGTVCAPDVVPFAEPAAAQTVQASGASKAALIPSRLRRLLAD